MPITKQYLNSVKTLLVLALISFACTSSDKTKYDDSEATIPKTCEIPVKWGDVNICLPIIDGMNECYNHPILKTMLDSIEYDGNTVLAYYLNNPAYKEIGIFKPDLEDYFKVYATNSIKNKEVGTEELDMMVTMMKKGFLNENWGSIKESFEKKISNVSAGKPVIIESYSPNEKVRTVVIIMKYQAEIGEFVKIMAINFVVVEERLISFAYYLNYDGFESIKKLKAKNDYFAFRLIDENS